VSSTFACTGCFLYGPPAVVRAVARGLRRTNRNADGEVRRFMNENLHRVRREPQRMPVLVTRGAVYDLKEVYDRLNVRFFGGRLRVPSAGVAAAAVLGAAG